MLALDPPVPTIQLRVFSKLAFLFGAVGLLAVIVALWLLGGRSGILRDSVPDTPVKQRPYSLARVQMAWWSLLIVGSFVFIWIVTQDHTGIVDPSSLILMGVATGTVLGASVIDVGKQSTASTDAVALKQEKERLAKLVDEIKDTSIEIKKTAQPSSVDLLQVNERLADATAKLRTVQDKLAALPKLPVTQSFLLDLVTDANGVTLHRFQMLIWTVVLGIVFIIGVVRTLAMPQFDATLLALMGIASGTYLGFKIPEKVS